MSRKALLFFLLFILSCPSLFAQEESSDLEDALEELAAQTDEEMEEDDRFQLLQAYLTQPLDLNKADLGDLQPFFFLNELQIHSFLKYRKVMGDLLSIYELQAVPQWDEKTIERILPYVRIGSGGLSPKNYSLSQLFQQSAFSGLFRYKRILEKQKGYRPTEPTGETKYLGSPNAYFFRMRYQLPQHFSMGLTAETDAGEPFRGYGQKGFDFYSFHFYLKDQGILKDLAVGDFRVNMGQGLVNQQGLNFGKTGMVMMIDRSNQLLLPHTSAMEYGFYRGVAATIGKRKWSATIFLSQKPEDSNLRQAIDSSHFYFQSLQNIGYHRTIQELEHKGSIKKKSAGSNLKYDFGKGHLGLNVVYHHFSDSMKRSGQPYQLFNQEGKEMLNASLDYALFLDKLYLFGETASNENGALATVNGLLMGVDKKVDLALLYRNYAPQYTSLYAKGFGESSRPQNESGFYFGLSFHPKEAWTIDAYSDFFKSKWLRYRVDRPSTGKEYFFQTTYQPSKSFKMYLRYRSKFKPINELTGEPLAKVRDTKKHTLRLFLEKRISPYIRIRSQLDGVYFKQESSDPDRGFMIFQNMAWETNKQWSGNVRLGYFNTDSYDARIYTFENNVRYAYYIPAFDGEGVRAYLNLRINTGRKLSVWTRLAQTRYFDRKVVGSGWNEIAGKNRTELTVQLIWD